MMEKSERDRLLCASDETLCGECRLEFIKGTGNGGQKRNKASSAVRVTHDPTGITASDCVERSQFRNRASALRKWRMTLALTHRAEPAALPRTECAVDHADYPWWCALVCDALAASDYDVKPAAEFLGMSSTGLLKKLSRDPQLWQHVNQCRAALGKHPLNPR